MAYGKIFLEDKNFCVVQNCLRQQKFRNFYIHFEPCTKPVDKMCQPASLKFHYFYLVAYQTLLAPCPLSAIVQLCQAVISNHGLSPARKLLTNSSIQHAFVHLKNGHCLSTVEITNCSCSVYMAVAQ